eukprot:m.1130765 g.1130765  ORF g.1130765 m.1130765 type:complete len:1104 (-) comp24423_c2_seq4:2530-5841(-)
MSLMESFHVPRKHELRKPLPENNFLICPSADSKLRGSRGILVSEGVASHIPDARERIRLKDTQYVIPREYGIGISTLRAVIACLESVPAYTSDSDVGDRITNTERVCSTVWDMKVLFRVAPAAEKLRIYWLADVACDVIVDKIQEAHDAATIEDAFALADMQAFTEVLLPCHYDLDIDDANDHGHEAAAGDVDLKDTKKDNGEILEDMIVVESRPQLREGERKYGDHHTQQRSDGRPLVSPVHEKICPLFGCKNRLVRGWRHMCRICHKDVCSECCTKRVLTDEQKETFDVLVPRSTAQNAASLAIRVITDPQNAFKDYVCLECARVCESPERKQKLARSVFAMCMFRRPMKNIAKHLLVTDLVKLSNVQKYKWGEAASELLSDAMQLQHKTADAPLKKKEARFLHSNRRFLLGHARWFVQLVRSADWSSCSYPADFVGDRVLDCEIVGCHTPCKASGVALLDANMAYEILCGYPGEMWGESSDGWSKSLINLRTACIGALEAGWAGHDTPPVAPSGRFGDPTTDNGRGSESTCIENGGPQQQLSADATTPFVVKETLWFLSGLVRAVVDERYNIEKSALLAYLYRCARRSVDVCVALFWALQEQAWHGRVGQSLSMSLLMHEGIDRAVREDLLRGSKFVEALLRMHNVVASAVPDKQEEKHISSDPDDVSPQSSGQSSVLPHSTQSKKAEERNGALKIQLAQAMRMCGLVDYIGDMHTLRLDAPVRMPHNPELVCDVLDMHKLHVKPSSQRPVVFQLGGHRASHTLCGNDRVRKEITTNTSPDMHTSTENRPAEEHVNDGGHGDVPPQADVPASSHHALDPPMGSIHACTSTRGRCHATVAVKGEDMRKDVLIMNVLRWIEHTLNTDPTLASYKEIPVVTYNVMCIGADCGLLEFVPDSSTVQGVQEHSTVAEWMTDRVHAGGLDNADGGLLYRYMKSLAASIVVSYVLGLGDRHDENVMITKDGRVFHIDFGFVVGEDPKKPLKPTIPIRRSMLGPLGSETSSLRKALLDLVPKIYHVLRKHSPVLFTMIMEIPWSGIPDVNAEAYAEQLKRRFAIGKCAKEAEEEFMVMFHNAIGIREQTMLGVYNKLHEIGVWFNGMVH